MSTDEWDVELHALKEFEVLEIVEKLKLLLVYNIQNWTNQVK